MSLIKIIFCYLGLIDNLVYTKDFDGDVRLRIARRSVFGEYICHGIVSWTTVQLAPDGGIKRSRYVEAWKPYRIGRKMRAWMEAAR